MNLQLVAIICALSLIIIVGAVIIICRTLKKRAYYKELLAILDQLDRKYLLPEMLRTPTFRDAKILAEVLYATDKSMNEEIAGYRQHLTDFRDYIELWVHEVKAPLSSLSLSLRASDRGSKIYAKAIESFIDQALYYSKLDTADKDYVIKKVKLSTTVGSVIKNHKDALIDAGIKIHLENLDHYIYSDPKWLEFIINQIVLNAIKYRRSAKPEITIVAVVTKTATTLAIRDNGIGIKPSEQKRIFEKGFTGSNDRKRKTSTGMGLYISKKLATDLGHQLSVSSRAGKYTELTIIFGHNNYYRT